MAHPQTWISLSRVQTISVVETRLKSSAEVAEFEFARIQMTRRLVDESVSKPGRGENRKPLASPCVCRVTGRFEQICTPTKSGHWTRKAAGDRQTPIELPSETSLKLRGKGDVISSVNLCLMACRGLSERNSTLWSRSFRHILVCLEHESCRSRRPACHVHGHCCSSCTVWASCYFEESTV